LPGLSPFLTERVNAARRQQGGWLTIRVALRLAPCQNEGLTNVLRSLGQNWNAAVEPGCIDNRHPDDSTPDDNGNLLVVVRSGDITIERGQLDG
jgi:hypothetical protein